MQVYNSIYQFYSVCSDWHIRRWKTVFLLDQERVILFNDQEQMEK